MVKRSKLMKMVAVSIVLLFLISGFSYSIYQNHQKVMNERQGLSGDNSRPGSAITGRNQGRGAAMDYVQQGPVYNFNYKMEAAQSFVSWYYGNETPSMLTKNMSEVQFYENGLPNGTEWEIKIINESSRIPEYYQNYTSNGTELAITLPNGNYDYVAASYLPQYVTRNATGNFSLKSSNKSFELDFFISPVSISRQYLTIDSYSTEELNLTPDKGPGSLSFGVMNSTLNIILISGNSTIYNRTISGRPTQWSVIQTSDTYGYVNFNFTGYKFEMIVKNLGNRTGLLTYDLWDYYISNYTASLITLPPQFAENFYPFNFNIASNIPPNMSINTGLSFVLKAPYYKFPVPLAIWIGEGYINPSTGKAWWAQVGFNNWLGGMNDVSYAGWGIFSNIFGSPGGTDAAIPLIPNDTYNFTMELINNTTWGFLVNGIPINEPGLNAFFNTTSSYSNAAYAGYDLGFEVLTQVRAGSPNSSSFLPNPIEVVKSMMMRINGKWITAPRLSYPVVGEDWWNGNFSASMGMDLWSVQGNIQNKSIPPGEIIFSNSNIPFFNIPSYQNLVAYPIYGNFSYPYQNISSYGNFINVKYENNGTIYVKPNFKDVLVSLIEFVNDSNILKNFTNYIISNPTYINNPYNGNFEAIVATLGNNTSQGYGGKFQEIVLTHLKEYNINYIESGLHNGTSWYVNISNGQSYKSTGTEISLNEPNGTYSYVISSPNKSYSPNPSSGSITVNGSNLNIPVCFHLVTYEITFTENGLPPGTSWIVISNGQVFNTTNDSIALQLPNGSYEFTILTTNKEYSVQGGALISLTVNGTDMEISITFHLVTYEIAFTETGLPPGTSWSITLNNVTIPSTNATIVFDEPNGSYSYVISPIPGYRASTYSGTIIVNGNKSYSINPILWTIISYPITITEKGIPNGTSWSVTLSGKAFNGQLVNITLNSTIDTITFNEPNGSYFYTVHLPSGFSGNTKGNITVSGQSITSQLKAEQSLSYIDIAVIAAVIIIAVIGAMFAMRRKK